MYLKRVKLRNFKSFSGAVEVPFQTGFTGIAGPNGMGKSNISDAILFVLGPTSSKALRADRLTHLFFNGGASKKPATDCEVSLVFDNADRTMPVDGSDVEITRYVKLAPSDPNGYYSYFYVNGRRSTQAEIDSLLSHARLSGDGYNIVQQGDVNRIVSMGPVPRRGLVERLAGIAQYDDELARAGTKRADLETNLTQIATLLSEIRSRLTALETQRRQAIEYKQVQDEKRRAEARLARAGHLLAQQEVASCEQQLAKLQAELEKLVGDAARLEGERDQVNRSIDGIEKEIARRGGEEATRFKTELDQSRMNVAVLDEKVRRADEELAGLRSRANEVKAELDSLEADRDAKSKAEKELAARVADAERSAAETTKALEEAAGVAEHSQGRLAELRREILLLDQKIEKAQTTWQGAVQAFEAAKAAVDAAEVEKARAEDELDTRKMELRDAELRSKPTKGASGGTRSSADLQKELFQLRAKEKQLTADAKSLETEVSELNRQYLALDARLKARSESGRGSSASAVEFLLGQRNLGKLAGIRGTVEELSQFKPEHAAALTIAAGARFQSLVVETDQVAEECIKLLRAEKRGRATFLPLNKMLEGRPKGKSLLVAQAPGALGFAIDLVEFDEGLRPAFWYVFGETIVLRDLASARAQMGGVRLVTLTGELIEATGAISGGSGEIGDRGRGAESAAELRRLGEALRTQSAEESAVRAELTKVSENVRSLVEELARRSGEESAFGDAAKRFEGEIASARQRVKETQERISAAEAACAKAEAARTKAESESTRFQNELAGLQGSRGQLQEQYLAAMPGSISQKFKARQDAAQKAAEARVELVRELEAARGALSQATAALEAKRKEVAELKAALPTKEKERKELQRSGEQARQALEALRAVEAQQLEAVRGQTDQKRALEEKRLELVGKVERGREAIQTRRDLVTQQEVRLATARQHFAEVEQALQQFPAAEDDGPAVPVDELKRSISTLSAQLDAMGSVNLRALEEYDQEKARADEFESEANRLTSEKEELVKLVAEVEKKKRERIVQVVDSVNRAFKEIYADLSGGGEGEIALESTDDPLQAGLLIRARPVGKIIRRLEQLSGGEKSLASLAFVFALQRYDPSPLYVFDEVDMSLDGVNAENVGRMLRRNAERAQFIVISLRKVTLKFAHRLFGVTMHGDGVSRVVSLNLDEIVDVDERDRLVPPAVPVEAA
jgi:chromosome segregation protein